MKDIIAIGVIVIVVGLAVFYIIKSKKKGVKCIGCPVAGKCGKQCDGQCSEYK